MELIKEGCPLCKGDVKGNDEHNFYCEHCNLLFTRQGLKIGEKELQRPIQPEEDSPQKVKKLGLRKEKGWLYYVDKEGDISRAKMSWAKK